MIGIDPPQKNKIVEIDRVECNTGVEIVLLNHN